MIIFQIRGFGLDSKHARKLAKMVGKIVSNHYKGDDVVIEIVPSNCFVIGAEKRFAYIAMLAEKEEIPNFKKAIKALCDRGLAVRVSIGKVYQKKKILTEVKDEK